MTPERLIKFGNALSAVAAEFGPDVEHADTDHEVIMYGLAMLIEKERQELTIRGRFHALVDSCLGGCVEYLRHAGFAYYASTK